MINLRHSTLRRHVYDSFPQKPTFTLEDEMFFLHFFFFFRIPSFPPRCWTNRPAKERSRDSNVVMDQQTGSCGKTHADLYLVLQRPKTAQWLGRSDGGCAISQSASFARSSSRRVSAGRSGSQVRWRADYSSGLFPRWKYSCGWSGQTATPRKPKTIFFSLFISPSLRRTFLQSCLGLVC